MGEQAVWITRRSFILGALATGGCAVVAGPGGVSDSGGFGSDVPVASVADVDRILADAMALYSPDARAYIVAVPEEWREPLKEATDPILHQGIDEGYAALFQTCPHLGCRVPECAASNQFECPCHGSLYGPLGEKRGGPAPRGMDRFETWVEDETLWVATGNIIPGTPIGTDLGEAEPYACVEPAEDPADG